MSKIALFPGSFDPITIGHIEIVRRGLMMFDKVIVAIGINTSKSYLFSLESRLEMLRLSFDKMEGVEVTSFDGLTVDFAEEQGAPFLLRGLRSNVDLSYERPVSLINRHLKPEIDTLFLHSYPETAHISSTIVREVIKYGGKLDGLVPDNVKGFIEDKVQKS